MPFQYRIQKISQLDPNLVYFNPQHLVSKRPILT